MGKYTIRHATSNDIPLLMGLDHNFSTDYVWQMSIQKQPEETAISFREVRLPRPMRVTYPRDPKLLADEWVLRTAFFVAEGEDGPMGYMALVEGPAPSSVWVTDLVVSAYERRQGIGGQLLRSGIEWAREREITKLFIEMQSKNYPAISLAKKMGFHFVGYSDSYYPDQDIALFFSFELG
ncbi:MAG: GNAT family N-acetyltransferase [Anaerolineales bacterium]|nr:GNAT family N-acetyltransferase [Anaerolineales bacterium]